MGSYLAVQPSSSGASVVTTTVQRGTVLATVSASGTVEPSRNLGLNFTTGGKLTNIYVKGGQHVHAGQKLARVDPTTSNQALQMAEASLGSASAQLAGRGVQHLPGAPLAGHRHVLALTRRHLARQQIGLDRMWSLGRVGC